ncbi:MAG: hypothetical protein HZA28_03565 [Candidatus Omnitrophica bacterium]|nr:hypothetical protein [Candidatus Omnitrophota bacterium]
MAIENELDFETLIKEAAQSEENKPIPNSTGYHAYVGIKYLINKAKNKVSIVSSQLREKFWKNLNREIEQFLAKDNTKLEILIQEFDDKNRFIQDLVANSKGKAEIRLISATASQRLPDFLTIDSMGYRFETADDKESLVQGIINFGDSEGTTSLNALFAKTWTNSKKI